MSKFEDNLWAELERDHSPTLVKSVVSRRRWNTGRWLGAAAAVAVLGTGAVFAPSYFGGTPPAYAVIDNPDGSVTLTMKEWERVDAAAALLRARGIPVIAVPRRDDCPDAAPKVDPGPVDIERALENLPVRFESVVIGGGPGLEFRVRVRPDRIPRGTTWVLADGDLPFWGFYPNDRLPSCVPTRIPFELPR